MQSAASIGFYGKLPCKGDFLQRRVPQEFVDAWDAWLQQGMHLSRQQLEERWLDTYLTSPVWRFALAEGTCGSGTYAGVMLASVDRVGRYFPLTLVAQLSSEECLLHLACEAGRHWLDAMEALGLHALQAVDLDLDAFDEQLGALAEQVATAGMAEAAKLRHLMHHDPGFARRPAQWHVPLAAATSLQTAVNALAQRELERTLRPLALWWTDGSDVVAPSWLCGRGLPAAESFAAMLAGDWRSRGWETLDPDGGAALLARMPGMPQPQPPADSQWGSPAPLASPAEPFEVSAWHEPLVREAGVVSSTHHISRPELGIWGIVGAPATGAGAAAAQMLADVLYSLPQADTLTALVEDTRRSLESVAAQLQRSAATAGAAPAQTILLLIRGDECALLHAGEVQAVRVRAANACLMTESTAAPVASIQSPSAPEDLSLMALIGATNLADGQINVRYEPIQCGDQWLLATAQLFEEPQLPQLAVMFESEELSGSSGFEAVRALAGRELAGTAGPPPLMLLAARPSLNG
jgi:type VI secretion system protein ImpM